MGQQSRALPGVEVGQAGQALTSHRESRHCDRSRSPGLACVDSSLLVPGAGTRGSVPPTPSEQPGRLLQLPALPSQRLLAQNHTRYPIIITELSG